MMQALRQFWAFVIGTVLGLVAVSLPATAHHSFAMFDTTKCLTMSGTVRKFEWGFPHTWIWINVVNKQGIVDAWGFEGEPPADLSRSGWRKSSLKKGDAVTVQYSPIRDGQKAGAFANVRLPNGSVLPGNRDACSKSGLKAIVPDTQGARQQ
jgi:Family of unknown function (DUF6152)